MKKLILLIFFSATQIYSQSDFVGKSEITVNENGILKKQTIIRPHVNSEQRATMSPQNSNMPLSPFNNTAVKWSYVEPLAIGDFCATSGNGNYNLVSWNLNNHRVSLYASSTGNLIWDFPTNPDGFLNYISISDTGGTIGAGSYQNIYLFNNTSNVPVLNLDLTTLSDTGIAGGVDVTNDGKFAVCSASRQDSSTVFLFSYSSGTPVWSKRILPTVINGAQIMGVKLSGNDSLVIVNTYYDFYVLKTFTGELVYQGLISGGTQSPQGISGDGKVIGVINYFGILRVLQWNGTTYAPLFSNQEPPGTFYNWYTSVDISYDGNYVAAGTLNFISTTEVDGKVKVFKSSGGGTPQWTYAGCGDEVSAVSFSKSGNILAASSWGEFNNLKEDLYIFKTYLGNVPIFKLNTSGSFFWCNTSNDGKTVVASGKAVHARQFGNGGLMYNIDVDTNDVPSSITQINTNVVSDYELFQNYPNPFNPNTVIRYSITENQFVDLKIYDASGKQVSTLVSQKQSPGSYEVTFDGSGLSSGVYFYNLKSGNFSQTRQMILLK